MTDVQRLCDVGAAVVHHDGFAFADLGNTKVRCGAHFLQIFLQKGAGELQVDEAGHDGFHQIIVALIQLGDHFLCNLNGRALVLLGGGQGAVALIFAQVGPVGQIHAAEGRIVTGGCKGRLHFRSDDIEHSFHY